MTGNLWLTNLSLANLSLTLCCAALLTASLPAASAAQPDQVLPPPPGGDATVKSPSDLGPGLSDLGPGKMPTGSPVQGPWQAPAPAVSSGPQLVTCTVMVPQTTFKTITVPDVVCRPETRQQNVTVCRMVPQTQMVSVSTTICVPERRTAVQPYTVCRMTYETATRQITVMVPHTEMRQGVRTVCQPVAVQETQTVCKDMGTWGAQTYVDCCGCTQTCRVWMPNMVTEHVPITVYKPQFVEQSYTYQVAVCRPEQRTINEQIAKPVYETHTREVSYVVPVAKQVERQVPKTTFRQVMENKVVNYTVMVPQRIERQVTVPVCTMVPKQVTYAVPTCGACGW